jgi:hypothetical protein
VPYGYRLPRADLAAFLVAQAENPTFDGSIVGISRPTRRTPRTLPAGGSAAAARQDSTFLPSLLMMVLA